jgi:peptide/nickel transport system permease protein
VRGPFTRALRQALWLLLVVAAACAVVHRVLAWAPGTQEVLPSFPSWLADIAAGDLGESTRYRVGAGVGELLSTAALESLILVGLALVFSMVGAALLAWLWQARGLPRTSTASRGLTYVLSASPAFLLAYWVQIAVNVSVARAVEAGYLERPEWFPVPNEVGFFRYALAAGVLALGSGMLMEAARSLSAEVERILKADFVLFARAGGEPIIPHVVPSLVGPVASLTLNRLTALFGGAVVVEVIFNVPGVGRLTWDAALLRDPHLLLGATLAWALVYGVGRLLAEVVSDLADPRRRAAGGVA